VRGTILLHAWVHLDFPINARRGGIARNDKKWQVPCLTERV
jgi:hypothetical protein